MDVRPSVAKQIAFGLTLGIFAASWIAPRWPLEQAMHGSLAVAGLAWLWWHDRRWPLRPLHYCLVCAFIVVHVIGAYWLYSYVPYDAWLESLFGWSPASAFGWRRNHYDRFVHLLYGLCLTPAIAAWVRQRWPRVPAANAFALAVMSIMCSSLVYEWMEWGIALVLSPEAAESYNGQQGDVWDAHADMLMATIGALLSWPLARTRDPSRGTP
jgi:putative membrane protein